MNKTSREHKKLLEESKTRLLSKKDVITINTIDNLGFDINNNKNDSFIEKEINKRNYRKSFVLSSSPMKFRISRELSTRNSHKINEDNKLSSKLLYSFKKEFKTQVGNSFIFYLNTKNDSSETNIRSYTERKKTNPFEIP